MDLIATLAGSPAMRRLASRLDTGGWCAARGIAGSSAAFTAAAAATLTSRPVLLITAHLDDADEVAAMLASVGQRAIHFPAMELLPGESSARLDLFAERLDAQQALLALRESGEAPVIVCAIQALMQGMPHPSRMASCVRSIAAGDAVSPGELIDWLERAGYARLPAIEEPGQYAVRGGIIDVFAPGEDAPAGPVRLDFFGDQVDRITTIDLETMGSLAPIERARFVSASLEAVGESGTPIVSLLPRRAVAVIVETQEVTEQARGYFARATGVFGPPAVFTSLEKHLHGVCELGEYSTSTRGDPVVLPVTPLPTFAKDVKEAVTQLAALADRLGPGRDGDIVMSPCQTPGDVQRLGELLRECETHGADRVTPAMLFIQHGFAWGEGIGGEPRLIVAPYHEIIHRWTVRRSPVRLRAARAMDTFLEFAEGDYVVHAEHGIARYRGLHAMRPKQVRAKQPGVPRSFADQDVDDDNEPREYLTLEFAGGSKLHVPAVRIDLVQKYVGSIRGKPELSTLGGVKWKTQKQRVAESVRDLASEMLRVRAARQSMPGVRFPADTTWQREFEDQFPYEETEDQSAAMSEIKRDMQADRPMDRLVCGDVGFGKTELAIRAAFKVVETGRQAAVLVPTTVLAEQHEATFTSRFAGFPFRIESISRFKTDGQAAQILQAVRKGQVDIVIGTHRLLSRDVKFADLGLVVIDEEQRFGVEHKEHLLRMRLTADVLTLSATPIPRTLHLSLLGLRDISSLATPPLDRQAVVTEVFPYNPRRIETAVRRELAREGQVFYVHNRVHDILSVADEVRRLAPEARVVVGHGQMSARELEDVMLRFTRREADILVCTTIIESGIDIPNANTIIVADAHRFGLADLHQLRGRVGRYKHRAYCYLMTPLDGRMTVNARQRLRAIEQHAGLGAGFKIAMRDLEIRGAGNLLGKEQSGHIAAVGYDMYCRLLDQAVKELSDQPDVRPSQTTVDLGISGTIPRTYIPSDSRRLDAYRRLCHAASADQLEQVRKDLIDAYGPMPEAAERLLAVSEVRLLAAEAGAISVVRKGPDIIFRARDPEVVADRLRRDAGSPGSVVVLPPKPGEHVSEVYFRPPPAYMERATLLAVLRRRLSPLAGHAPSPPVSPRGRAVRPARNG